MCERIVVGNDKQELPDEIRNVYVLIGMRNLEFATVLFAKLICFILGILVDRCTRILFYLLV
jgi:hypothetical protein